MLRGVMVVVLTGCSAAATPHLGVMTPGLKEWLRQQCVPEKIVESHSVGHIRLIVDMDDDVFAKYRKRPLVSIGCDEGEYQHIVYASDDNSLIEVVALPGSEQDAKGWLFELGDAGVDTALVAKARARVMAGTDDVVPFERDGLRIGVARVTRKSISWGISAEVTR